MGNKQDSFLVYSGLASDLANPDFDDSPSGFIVGNHLAVTVFPAAEAWVLTQDPVIGDRLGQLYERKNEPGAAIKAYTLALGASSNTVGGHPTMQETRERLERLKGEAQSSKAGGSDEDLGSMRTVHLGRIVPDSASAEFFLIFSAGPKVEDVKFISGSEKLKSAALVLTSTKFDVPFPDDISTRIVRRGVLSCFPVTGCSFVLYNPVDVGSLN